MRSCSNIRIRLCAHSGLPTQRTDALKIAKIVADNLTFLGIVAISDPVRIDVPDAVKEVIDAGIKVKIVTGDTPAQPRKSGGKSACGMMPTMETAIS